jgi:hypothetical protein
MNAVDLAARLTAAGFKVRLWRDRRVYIQGYGRDIRAYIEPGASTTLDDARIDITTSWRSHHATMHCKGVKHALLSDLFDAGLLDTPPPDHWRLVRIEDRPRIKRVVTLVPSQDADAMPWPFGR